jgi:hypothetical protein
LVFFPCRLFPWPLPGLFAYSGVSDNDAARRLFSVGTLAGGTITSVSKSELADSHA